MLLFQVAAAELAVAVVLHHGEIHIAIGGIGGAFGLQFADQAADCIKAAGGPRHAIGGEDIEAGHVGHEGLDIALAHGLHRAAFFGGAVENLVVNVGVVLHERHRVATPDQVAAQHIPGDVAAGMTEVAEVVHRDPAAIDAHLAGLERPELLNAAGEGVGELQGHR